MTRWSLKSGYCTTADDVCIAYDVSSGGTVVYASNIMGDVQWEANSEATRAQMEALTDGGRRDPG